MLSMNLKQKRNHLHILSPMEFLLQITYLNSFIHPAEVISDDLFLSRLCLNRILFCC